MAKDKDENEISFNFNIENTTEFGPGSGELMQGLFSTDPEDDAFEGIIKDIPGETTKIPAAEKPPKKDVPPKKSEEEKKDEPELTPSESLLSAILDEEIDDEEIDDPLKKKNVVSDDNDVPTETEFESLSKDLFRLGVFTKDDEEESTPITTPEQFLERFNLEKKKGADEILSKFIGRFGADYQEAFKAIYVNGVDPKEYFGAFNDIVDFSEIDLTSEQNQIMVVRKAMLDQGYDAEDVDVEITKLKDYGDLEQAATRHHKVLLKKQAANLQEMTAKAEQAQQRKIAEKKQYVSSIQSIMQEKLKAQEFDGIPVNAKLIGELQDFLLVDKWTNRGTGESLTDFEKELFELRNPKNYETRVKLALIMNIMKKDPTLSTIQRAGVTKKSNELFKETIKKTGKTEGAPRKSWFDGL